jgi:hypothetical protein
MAAAAMHVNAYVAYIAYVAYVAYSPDRLAAVMHVNCIKL